ncbi:MAG: molybdopterin cofactor-binding domain-containing protein, partial [Antricoccus sp.]
MPGSILGNEVQRLEDPELMTGAGTYTGDVNPEGLLFASFSRSPFAHADITSIDVADAKSMPGVVAVYTEADLDVAPFEGAFAINPVLARPLLAKDRVRFVGEAVVMVIAQTQAQADDAAEQVLVDFEPLDVVADMESAVAEGAPLLFDDIKGNIVMGTNDPTDSLAGADVVVRARVVNQRIAAVPMEGNAVVAIPPTGDEPFTIYLSSQGAHIMHGMVCKVLGMKPEDVRVITPYVGGAFGAKISVPQECVGAIAAARALGKPVKWAETRSENLTSMPHGR